MKKENDGIQCPVCKTDSYLNPNLQLYMSTCYHKLCETCLTYIFQTGYALCPECGQKLTRQSYRKQIFEDVAVEKECRIRKMLNNVMYRKEEDFLNEDEYNDYLEEYEDKVYLLMNSKEVNKEIEEIKKEYSKMEIRTVDLPKEVVVKKQIKIDVDFYDWFKDEDKDEFVFKREISLVDCFKHKSYVGGLGKYDIAKKAVKSIDNPYI